MNTKLKGNLAMTVSKVFSGFNQNALKYLVPHWMSAMSGVAMRLGFGAIAFWIIGLFGKKPAVKATVKQKLQLFLIGAILMLGYMWGLLGGLQYITPVTSSIFISLQPGVVFIVCAIFLKEKVTSRKVFGLVLGIGGALVCILTQHASAMATNPTLGCILCGVSLIAYSLFLVFSGVFIKKLDNVTVSKWTFTGGAVSSIIVVLFTGFHAPVLQHFFSVEMLVLAFVLLFPTTISYLLVDVGLRNLKATVVALYGNVILIVSTITAYLLHQDVFSWWQMLAIAMMIASVYFVEVAESKSSPQNTSSSSSNLKNS